MFSTREKPTNKTTSQKHLSSRPLPAHQMRPQAGLPLYLQRSMDNQATGQTNNINSVGSRVEVLRQQAKTPGIIRAMLAADPSLSLDIQTFFTMGNQDAQLNSLLAQAFPKGGNSILNNEGIETSNKTGTEKAGTGAGVTLPAARTGNKTLAKGQYKWSLTPATTESAKLDADFKPDQSKVDATAVSFVQTVLNKVGAIRAYGGGTAVDPAKRKSTYEPFEESTSHKRIDFFPDTENDPFYGAEWDQAKQEWVKEATSGSGVGSSRKGVSSTSATLSDTPFSPWVRAGKGDASIEFETAPVVLETREPLGSLKWGFKVKDKADAPLELTGAQDADCVDTPSTDWGKTLDKFYEARFDTILDNFDIAKFDLKPDHITKLDGIVARMKANAALKAQLGGAADLTGSADFNEKLALKRANAAKDYLAKKGIATGRIEVQSYGFNWARVEAEKGKSEGKNRRVQVWLR